VFGILNVRSGFNGILIIKLEKMITLKNQLIRLKENHDRCNNSGELNDFLDLVHTLRIFSDYGDKINDVILKDAKIETESISKELNKITKKPAFVILPIKPSILIKKTIIGNFFWLSEALPNEEMARITSPKHNFHKRNYTFDGFWGSQILYIRENVGGEIKSINRLELVKRTSNTLGASHIFKTPDNDSNDVDRILYDLYRLIKIVDIPLPFLCCYKIAQEILTMCGLFDIEKEKLNFNNTQ
tara:strand:- start:1431 stop:2159 length:729 start_codon:yes stop_codon:yes gene_type:complete